MIRGVGWDSMLTEVRLVTPDSGRVVGAQIRKLVCGTSWRVGNTSRERAGRDLSRGGDVSIRMLLQPPNVSAGTSGQQAACEPALDTRGIDKV